MAKANRAVSLRVSALIVIAIIAVASVSLFLAYPANFVPNVKVTVIVSGGDPPYPINLYFAYGSQFAAGAQPLKGSQGVFSISLPNDQKYNVTINWTRQEGNQVDTFGWCNAGFVTVFSYTGTSTINLACKNSISPF